MNGGRKVQRSVQTIEIHLVRGFKSLSIMATGIENINTNTHSHTDNKKNHFPYNEPHHLLCTYAMAFVLIVWDGNNRFRNISINRCQFTIRQVIYLDWVVCCFVRVIVACQSLLFHLSPMLNGIFFCIKSNTLPNNKAEKSFTFDEIRNTIKPHSPQLKCKCPKHDSTDSRPSCFRCYLFSKETIPHNWIVVCGITIQCQMQFIQNLSFKSTAFITKSHWLLFRVNESVSVISILICLCSVQFGLT